MRLRAGCYDSEPRVPTEISNISDRSTAPTRKARRSRVGLAVFALVALVTAGEVVARVAGLGDVSSGARTEDQAAFNEADMFEALPGDARQYRNRPLASVRVGDIEYRHDEVGLRATTTTPAADDARPRLLFLGDSTTYGLGVPADDALPRQVARALDERVVALNAGTSGYTTGQELAAYRALAPTLDPDLVVLVVYPNDLTDGALRWDSDLDVLYLDETPTPEALKPLLWRSALYRALVGAHTRSLDADPTRNPANMRFVLEPMGALARDVAEDGRRLVVAVLPFMTDLDPYLYADQHAEIVDNARTSDLPVVDLLSTFMAERAERVAEYESRTGQPAPESARRGFLHQYWIAEHDQHLDAAGNGIAARGLAPIVAQALDIPVESP